MYINDNHGTTSNSDNDEDNDKDSDSDGDPSFCSSSSLVMFNSV